MLPYYFLVFIPFFLEVIGLNLFSFKRNFFCVKRNNSSIIVFFVILFVLLSLRSVSCGTDLVNYEYFFQQTLYLNFLDVFRFYSTEQLFFVFNWFVGCIYPDFRLFMVVVALLCTGVLGWFYWKESEFAPLTILLFITNSCFVMIFSGLRQFLAMLFVVPAYYLTKQKRILPFILIVLIASFIHNSATIMFLLYPVFHIPMKSKDFFFVLFLVAIFFFFKTNLFNMVVPFLAVKYSSAEITETGAYSIWIMFILFLVYCFVIPDERKMTTEHQGLRNVLVLITLIQGFASIHTLAMRMNYYFILLIPIIIPKMMKLSKNGNENIVQYSKWIMVFFFTIYFFYSAYSSMGMGLKVFPYVAYWE